MSGISKNLFGIAIFFVILVLLMNNSNSVSIKEGLDIHKVQQRPNHTEYLDIDTPPVQTQNKPSINEDDGWSNQFNNDLAGSNIQNNTNSMQPEGNFVANNAAVQNLADFNQIYDSSLVSDQVNGENINDIINQKNSKQLNMNNADLLPQEVNDDWFQSDFSQSRIKLNENNIINSDKYIIGVNTVGSSLKNPSYDLRGTIPNAKTVVSPFLNSSIEPDYNIKHW